MPTAPPGSPTAASWASVTEDGRDGETEDTDTSSLFVDFHLTRNNWRSPTKIKLIHLRSNPRDTSTITRPRTVLSSTESQSQEEEQEEEEEEEDLEEGVREGQEEGTEEGRDSSRVLEAADKEELAGNRGRDQTTQSPALGVLGVMWSPALQPVRRSMT